ncbi:MAG: hypothetical protein JXB30_09015 [Anaerolineae bacterium]|nr:hypothetical protein [Anaerolineae bacterium]
MRKYIGLFLIAFAMLALEVTLTRLLSVITWYYLSFFAIATGLLGSTAGATSVYLQPNWFTKEKLERNIANCCLGFAFAIPVTLIILSRLRFLPDITTQTFVTLFFATFVCALPFYFAGMATTAILTRSELPIGKLYANDLAGAALGSLFVLGGLEVLDAPSLLILIGAIAATAWFVLGWDSTSTTLRRWGSLVPIMFVVLAFLNAFSEHGIRPMFYKGHVVDKDDLLLEKWNSYSQVVVFKPVQGFQLLLWGASPLTPAEQATQYYMQIDGEAGTTIREFSTLADIEHLRYDVTSMAYYVRPNGNSLIIGVGGGKDIHTALLFGHEHVMGVDINPIFIHLLTGEFAKIAGLANRSDVALKVAEGRSFASQSSDHYSVIQMSLIDTWAATGAGAFSLSENTLYTVEAWDVFFERLDNDGIFTVSRWYNPDNLGETGRVVSLAVATLIRNNVENPSAHIALINSQQVSTLLLSRQPFSEKDIRTLEETATRLQFSADILPGSQPKNETLRDIVAAKSSEDIATAIADQSLNFTPPTDENPYFFNMLRLDHIKFALQQEQGVLKGNLIATLTLSLLVLALVIVTGLTIIVPLHFKVAGSANQATLKPLWSAALYFSLIGSGFMLTEIALIQRLSVFLSHPIYALGVLLFTLIASTGVGSYLSERLPLTQKPWIYIYPAATAGTILALRFVLNIILAEMITSPMPIKIATAIVTIFPMGILLGLFFPTGMRLVRDLRFGETPWYWALNGVFSVLCSTLAVLISIYLGISVNFYLAAACYLVLPVCLWRINQMAGQEPTQM